MTFKLERDEKMRRELNGPVIQGLCGLLHFSNKDVKSAHFDKNKANITLKVKGGLNVLFPVRDYESPIQLKSHVYSESVEKGLHGFSFELNPDYKLKFDLKEGGFHSVAEKIFGRREDLEKIMRGYPETIDSFFVYNPMPFGLWHAIPKNVLAYVSKFSFGFKGISFGKDLFLSWPYGTGTSGAREQDSSRISISRGYNAEENYQQLVQNLVNNGLIRLETVEKKTQGVTQKEERLFLVQEGMDYKIMRDFEDNVADLNDGYGTARLDFSGEIPTRDLINIPKLFDEYISGARLKTDSFILCGDRFNQSIYVNGDLEMSARVAEILPRDIKMVKYTASQNCGDRKSFILYEQK